MFESRLTADEAVAATMDTAGKAVLFSGLTVLISLSAVLLVPSPAFRSTSLGIMLSVVFLMAAALTLLPAVLAKLGPRVNRFALPRVHSSEHHSPRSAAWARRLWRRAALRPGGARAARGARAAGALAEDRDAADQGRPGGRQLLGGLRHDSEHIRPWSDGPLQIVTPSAESAPAAAVARRDPGIARLMAPQPGEGGATLVETIPTTDPSARATGATIDRVRAALPQWALVGGPVAERHDLEAALSAKTPPVIGVVLGLSFLLLLVALQAPLIAALGVVTNLLTTAGRSASRSGSSRTASGTWCSDSSRRASWMRGGRCSSSR